jgi:hypothetical protein
MSAARQTRKRLARAEARTTVVVPRFDLPTAQQALESMDTPEQRRITAYHESSHAVMAELLGFPVDFVSCVPAIAPDDYHESMRARQMGAVLIRAGHIQLVLTDGVVKLPFPLRCFFYMLQELASIATEKRLGVCSEDIARSCSGDFDKAYNSIDTDMSPEARLYRVTEMAFLATLFVCNDEVWRAIERTAELLLEKGRIVGSDVRGFIKDVSEQFHFSEDRQRDIFKEEPRGPGYLVTNVFASSLEAAEKLAGVPAGTIRQIQQQQERS